MADELTGFIHQAMPLTETLGFRVVASSKDLVHLELDWRPELCTSGGLLHGGALMALADSAGGACAFFNLPEGTTGTSTVESKTNFLGAVRSGTVGAQARPLRVGGLIIVVETELTDDKGTLVAKTTQSQIVLRSSR
ncbi:MAG TPA: PaaI family thioesterase [Acidimicrobiales bacterium]|nr:PaaI family thioesterase [Acidimicrobiales bacterium]